MRAEFTLPLADGAWPMGPNEKGAYIVTNEEGRKIIYETQFEDSEVTDPATNVTTIQKTIKEVKVARLDPQINSPVVELYINKEAKYGVVVYGNGIIEVFEYDVNKGDWTKTIGPSDRNIRDDMVYARTQKYYQNPNNNIVAMHFDHTDDTLTVTFVGSTEGFL